MDLCRRRVGVCFRSRRRFVQDDTASIEQFSFRPVGTVTGMAFAGYRVNAPGRNNSFIVGAAFGTALLGVAALWIWHDWKLKIGDGKN